MKIVIVAVLAVLNWPLYRWVWKWIFGDWDEFHACLRFWFMPDIISLLRGEYTRDFFGELKIFLLLFICVGAVAAEYLLITMILEMSRLG